MPHSKFKEGESLLNSVGKCPCGQTFDYASERDRGMKFWLYRKGCPKLVSSKNIRIPKKAMTLREHQHYNAERMRRVLEY